MLYYSEETQKRYNENTLSKYGKKPTDSDVFRLIKQEPTYNSLIEYIKDIGQIKKDNKYYIEYDILPLPDEIKQKNLKKEKEALKKELLNLCEMKLVGARSIISQQPVTPALLEEYKRKQKALNDNDIEFFKYEAEVQGTTAQEEYDKAADAAPDFEALDDKFIKLIGATRRGYLKLLNTSEDIPKLKGVLEQIKTSDEHTTIEDIKNILTI